MSDNPLIRLHSLGQSIWQDDIRRDMLGPGGPMQQLIERDGIMGVTSNPAIFEKAIDAGADYDDDIRRLADAGRSIQEIYEALTVEDVTRCADLFRGVYDRTHGGDGFVSLEVSPHLANDTAGTIDEARHLWKTLNRPNVLIKVPGTQAGLPAIQQLIGEGISVNVTLLFGLKRYEAVAEAYIAGLESLAASGRPIDRTASVASFFLSRIDTLVDKQLASIVAAGGPDSGLASSLQGKIAIASAKQAYQIYKRMFSSKRWQALAEKGAMSQRLLWASTSTKNDAYSDVMYVEALIGPDTINTAPPETIDAYRDHGKPAARLESDLPESVDYLRQLDILGIDLADVTRRLEEEGVAKFIQPYDKLFEALRSKVAACKVN